MNHYALLFAGVPGLAGCGSVDVNTYKDQSPRLDLREYFDGTIDAYGMFQNRQGEVVRRFHVLIEASWDGDVGTLDERFTYADGSTDHRVWTITRHAQGEYSGEAADVVGTARGRAGQCLVLGVRARVARRWQNL